MEIIFLFIVKVCLAFLQNINVSVTYEGHSSAEQHFPEKCFEAPQVLFVQQAFRPKVAMN